MADAPPPRWGWSQTTSSAARPTWPGIRQVAAVPRRRWTRRLELAAGVLVASSLALGSAGTVWVVQASQASPTYSAASTPALLAVEPLSDAPEDVTTPALALDGDGAKPAITLASSSRPITVARSDALVAGASARPVDSPSEARDDAKRAVVLATPPPAAPRPRAAERAALPLLAVRVEPRAPAAVSPAPPQSAAPRWNTAAPALPTPAAPATAPRRLSAQITAYSASATEGTAQGITASGVPARLGTVAVDPRVIPLGSKLRIEGLPGIYRAEDTGRGVRGAHVDVFMDSRGTALQFGRRSGVTIEVLD
jgi:3D (Asp-Asp-Asp) domain-containing protein